MVLAILSVGFLLLLLLFESCLREGVGAVEFYRRIARACDDIRAQLAQAIRKLDREILKQTFRGALCALPWRILRPPRRSLATTALTLRNDVQCEIVIVSSPAMEAVPLLCRLGVHFGRLLTGRLAELITTSSLFLSAPFRGSFK